MTDQRGPGRRRTGTGGQRTNARDHSQSSSEGEDESDMVVPFVQRAERPARDLPQDEDDLNGGDEPNGNGSDDSDIDLGGAPAPINHNFRMADIVQQRRGRQLKWAREAIKQLRDKLGIECGGLYTGKEPDKALWFLALADEVLENYMIGNHDEAQLTPVDECCVIIGCLGGGALEVVRAAKLTQGDVRKDPEVLRSIIIDKFLGELTMFDLKTRAWNTKQKAEELSRNWCARIQILMMFFIKKEIIETPKYKEVFTEGAFANAFNENSLKHYDWATTHYWEKMLKHLREAGAASPWAEACWENYEISPGRKNDAGEERLIAVSEGGKGGYSYKAAPGVGGNPPDKVNGPRVELGFWARPCHERLRMTITGDANAAWVNAQQARPPGQDREELPGTALTDANRGPYNVTYQEALAAPHDGAQDYRRVVICDRIKPRTWNRKDYEFQQLNHPQNDGHVTEGIVDSDWLTGAWHMSRPRTFWPSAPDAASAWHVPTRRWNMYTIDAIDQDNKDMRNPRELGETITDGIREGNDTLRIFFRGALMGMMVEEMRNVMHETMTIFIKNAIAPLRIYLMENGEYIKSMKSALKYAEQWERAQGKTGQAKVAEVALKSAAEDETEEEYNQEEAEIAAFG